MSSRSRSHRTALVRRRLFSVLLALVVGMTAAASSSLPLAKADPARPAVRLGPPLTLTRTGMPGWPAGSLGPALPVGGVQRVPPLRPPVGGRVARGFEAPSGPYGPGHRGIDLAAPLGAVVSAPAGGRVVFAGQVAGLRWVSVEVAKDVVVTVGPLDRPVVAAGQQLFALSGLGRLAAGHPGGLHLGLRIDGVYVDPLPYLVGAGPPRLAPLPLPGGATAPT